MRRNVQLPSDYLLMGANAGTRTCGVTWGNGTKEELENAGATFIIDRMSDLLIILEDIRKRLG